ncbi:CDP-alcohol phosphatidyltransferase family protein [Polaribacter butkevichii]|uniref:Phosphatidylserine synthase n=1 Tax=Polaribacter butkevichii TaxID=218490 RepID=A0A2P6CEK2_9FLAO|nr:CDP-alcohol phosphatidyltransferase family protein [Polaribacter butkevichii]PQJ73298.1 phosphatidylserine synthase [Polaribacter butkevichii]
MNLKKHIPNLITLGNLFCGTVATIFAVEGDYVYAGLFVVLGILFDFFDGFAARLLKVSGELGKQLDSLADMVTSGVVPGIIVYKLLIESTDSVQDCNQQSYLPFIGLLLTLGACYRLAKFNIDTRQSDSFIGLPTPAMSLFIISLPLIQEYSTIEFAQELITSNYFLIAVTLILTYLMNAELPLFSLKFKDYSFKKNIIVYSFLFASFILIYTLHFISIPFIIILYIIISLINKIIVFNGNSQNPPK